MQTVAADGEPFPMASLLLTLDDEVQYRCAGYVQAEIERFAEGVDDDAGSRDGDSTDESDEEKDGDAAPVKGKKGKDGKGKKATKDGVIGMPVLSSQSCSLC
jgi:cohesin complex subunit SA-1/2